MFAQCHTHYAYWQVPVHPSDVHKSIFIRPLEIFAALLAPFSKVSFLDPNNRESDGIVEGLESVAKKVDDILMYEPTTTVLYNKMHDFVTFLTRCSEYNTYYTKKIQRLYRSRIGGVFYGFVLENAKFPLDPELYSAVANCRPPPPRVIIHSRSFFSACVLSCRMFLYRPRKH